MIVGDTESSVTFESQCFTGVGESRPMVARFQPSVHPGSHGHTEDRRRDVRRLFLRLCSGIGYFGGLLHAELSANLSSSRLMCSILLDGCILLVIWIAIDWFLSSTLRLHSRITPTRPLTLTMFYIWLSFVGEFTFADGNQTACWS